MKHNGRSDLSAGSALRSSVQQFIPPRIAGLQQYRERSVEAVQKVVNILPRPRAVGEVLGRSYPRSGMTFVGEQRLFLQLLSRVLKEAQDGQQSHNRIGKIVPLVDFSRQVSTHEPVKVEGMTRGC